MEPRARYLTVDGNEAAAAVAHRLSEVMAQAQHDVDARWRLYEQLGEMERDDT